MKAGGLPLHDRNKCRYPQQLSMQANHLHRVKSLKPTGKSSSLNAMYDLIYELPICLRSYYMWAFISSFIAFALSVAVGFVFVIMAFIFGLFAEMFYGLVLMCKQQRMNNCSLNSTHI